MDLLDQRTLRRIQALRTSASTEHKPGSAHVETQTDDQMAAPAAYPGSAPSENVPACAEADVVTPAAATPSVEPTSAAYSTPAVQAHAEHIEPKLIDEDTAAEESASSALIPPSP